MHFAEIYGGYAICIIELGGRTSLIEFNMIPMQLRAVCDHAYHYTFSLNPCNVM